MYINFDEFRDVHDTFYIFFQFRFSFVFFFSFVSVFFVIHWMVRSFNCDNKKSHLKNDVGGYNENNTKTH